MGTSSTPRGLVIELVTPFTPEGRIDTPSLGRLLERVLPQAEAVFLGGPAMGEGLHLAPEERAELLAHAIRVVGDRVPILQWITREAREDTLETLQLLDRRARDLSIPCRLFWVDAPLYYHSNRGLVEHYHQMCSLTTRSFILYNGPALIGGLNQPFKRANIRTHILKELVALTPLAGLIYLGTLDRFHHYQRASHVRHPFPIYDGDEAHFLDHPSVSGVVSHGAQLAPAAWKRIVSSSLQLGPGQRSYPDSLRQIWQTGGYLRALKERYDRGGLPLLKMALTAMQVIASPTLRASSVPSPETPHLLNQLQDLLQQAGDFPPKA